VPTSDWIILCSACRLLQISFVLCNNYFWCILRPWLLPGTGGVRCVIHAVFWNATLCSLLLCELCNLEPRALYYEDGGIGCLRNVAKLRDTTSRKTVVCRPRYLVGRIVVYYRKRLRRWYRHQDWGLWKGVRPTKEIINIIVDAPWKSVTWDI
jgi:hypothetical protein